MKIVKESISFKRGLDPKSTLGIGQRHFIEKWLKEMEIYRYVINDDLTIDVDHNINLEHQRLSELPEYIQFNIVQNFLIGFNQLTTLRGCPKKVLRTFACSFNQLTSLDYAPKEAVYEFRCRENPGKFTEKDVRKVCKTISVIVDENY